MQREKRPNGRFWWRSPGVLSLAGGLLLWASFPPLNLPLLAWLAPLPWLWLIALPELPGRRVYRAIWLGSLLQWLLMLQGIRLAHWVNHFGWFALSAYLGVYLPAFVGLTRRAVKQFQVPLILAAPIIWTGLELVRAHLFTGFSMGMLGHTQFEYSWLIQIADLGGAYAVSFLLMLVSAGAFQAMVARSGWRARFPASGATMALAGSLLYGWSSAQPPDGDVQPGTVRQLKVALIQSDFNTTFAPDLNRGAEIFQRYWTLTEQARDQNPDLDLVVWPESVFTNNLPELLVGDTSTLPDEVSREQLEGHLARQRYKRERMAEELNQVGVDGAVSTQQIRMLVGTETLEWHAADWRLFNAALLLGPTGQVEQRYYKMHPVMFGEYIPFGRWFPAIYRWTPMPQGLTPGVEPVAFQVGSVRLSPSICFESSVPHLLRRQVQTLTERGESPDVLVNLTHDGWFWGSSILDYQLAGAVFRAVELRRPMLVAANAGISAWIDGAGRIRARGPRQGEAHLIADIAIQPRFSFYAEFGDWLSGTCLLATSVIFLASVITRFRFRRRPRSSGLAG